jgi:hypothetical protein
MKQSLFAFGVGLAALLSLVSCGLDEFKKQEDRIRPLVERKASKIEVATVLGTNFVFYAKGETNWDDLTRILTREPPTRMVAVRQGVAHWPFIMFYSTPDMMTWVFLDEEERAASFVVGAQ